MSERERGRRMAAERAGAHLARAESELQAAQRFVDPGGGGEDRTCSRQGDSQRQDVRLRREGDGPNDPGGARRLARPTTSTRARKTRNDC